MKHILQHIQRLHTRLEPTHRKTILCINMMRDRAEISGVTHSLTGVWTLGRLEAGCFYFHVLQHNIVYKMDLIWSEDKMGETALHEEYSTSFSPLPRRGCSTTMRRMQRQTWAERLWKPRSQRPSLCHWQWMGPGCCRYNCADQDADPRVPQWLIRRLTSLRNMAANILLRSDGFTRNKGARSAYFGQIALQAISLRKMLK